MIEKCTARCLYSINECTFVIQHSINGIDIFATYEIQLHIAFSSCVQMRETSCSKTIFIYFEEKNPQITLLPEIRSIIVKLYAGIFGVITVN